MKRKFGIGPLKVNTLSNNPDENWSSLVKSADRDDSTYVHLPRPPHLDAKTESELRKACAFILKDLKPSGHDLEDTRMKTDILVDLDDGDNKAYGVAGSYSAGAKSSSRNRWPYAKRDASRSKDRLPESGNVPYEPQESGSERQDDRDSRSPQRRSYSPHQSRRRAPTAVVEEQVPAVPFEFVTRAAEPVPKMKEENQGRRNQPVDSSEASSLAQSSVSTNPHRSTSTGVTSAMITPALASQRTSENGLENVIVNHPLGIPITVSKHQDMQPQTPERLETPPINNGSRAMGSNLEAQAVAIISGRVTNKSSLDPSNSDSSWRKRSMNDLKSPSPRLQGNPRPASPEPSRALSVERATPAPPIQSYETMSNPYETETAPKQRLFIPAARSESDDDSSVTDDDSSSTEDKENYISETQAPIPSAGPSATPATWVSKMEGRLAQQEATSADPREEGHPSASSSQPIVHPKNPLRFGEPEPAVDPRETKLAMDIRDKSEEPLATARARIDSRAHSRHTSIYMEQQQQQRSNMDWDGDARPLPLNLKSKTSTGHLASPLTDGNPMPEVQDPTHALTIDEYRPMPIHVPNPLPSLKHDQDESITVKDFWKPVPKAPESVRSFSRPGTGGATHRRQPAQEIIDGLVQPLRPFSATNGGNSDRPFTPVENVGPAVSGYIPSRTYDRQATAGPIGTSTAQRQAPKNVYHHAPTFSMQSTTSHPRLSSMANSTRSNTRTTSQPPIVSLPLPQHGSPVPSSPTAPSVSAGSIKKKQPRGLMKLLHRMGGGDLPERKKAVVVQQDVQVEEEEEDYYDDDQACEAPVVRFGRGW